MRPTRHRQKINKVHASQKRMTHFLKGKAKAEMKEILKGLANDYLGGLSRMALIDEEYEICQAVHELINERRDRIGM